MDDTLETPNALAKNAVDPPPEERDDEQPSEDEDGAPDWTKLLSNVARPTIPKRGEKDFEPAPGGGSGLQLHVLDRARSAMLDALKATRATSSKAISYAVWHPRISRAHVTLARGIHFSAMGHSAPRQLSTDGGMQKIQKRLELLPEETIYLVERGTLFCWKESALSLLDIPGMADIHGPPMSVQQVYSEMIGTEDLTLERFQVFAYLKRLGYIVTRAHPPNSLYPSPPSCISSVSTPSLLQRIRGIFPLWTSKLSRFLTGGFNWWKPLQISRWLHHDKNYASIFRSLRFIPSGHGIPLLPARRADPVASPYKIFFNLYKPSTPFKKTAPPPPDFQLVVINARTTPMPTLHELTDLFDVLPELPTPLPRQRRQTPAIPIPEPPKPTATPSIPWSSGPVFRRVFSWAFSRQTTLPQTPVRKPNPFMALKAGKKMAVIAVVDAGSISFFRFCEGVFTEWPMV